MSFLIRRPRRLRENKVLREMLSNTVLNVKDFIFPMFIVAGEKIKKPIKSMPGQFHFSKDEAAKYVAGLAEKGLRAVILFGLPEYKDATGSSGAKKDGPVQEAIKAIKKTSPHVLVITDVCLCEYTDHGHCGIIKNKKIDNDLSLEHLARQALSHAESGADMVAPSDMMDGRIKVIRDALDASNFKEMPIMAYSVKYASAFYGPFREAADSTPQFGDRRSYQMNPNNINEALVEASLDEEQGADILMVKPAGPYLDIISKVKEYSLLPLAAYQVSGEYAMLKVAAQAGLVQEKEVVLESLIAIKRAGADLILSYFTPDILNYLNSSNLLNLLNLLKESKNA